MVGWYPDDQPPFAEPWKHVDVDRGSFAHACGHRAAGAGLSERSIDIRQGEDCDACMQAAVERDIAAGRRNSDGTPR